MTLHVRSAPALVLVGALLLGASAAHAQLGPLSSGSHAGTVPANSTASAGVGGGPLPPAPLYIACRAEAPSQGAAYFSATFESHTPRKARKEFRELVATRYGAVSEARCAGSPSSRRTAWLVQKWKDDARAANNTIVNTGWER